MTFASIRTPLSKSGGIRCSITWTIALDAGLLSGQLSRTELKKLIVERRNIPWNRWVRYYQSKDAILRYISRYLRRPPLAEYRLIPGEGDEVRF